MQPVEIGQIEYLEEDLETIVLDLGPDNDVGTNHGIQEYTKTVNQFYAIEKLVFNPICSFTLYCISQLIFTPSATRFLFKKMK